MARTIELTKAYKCESCEAISDDAGPALYECGDCGSVFNRDNGNGAGHQCPNCNKFASKVADQSCANCEEGEVEEIEAIQCACHEEWHEVS